jgi:hypothetical protein
LSFFETVYALHLPPLCWQVPSHHRHSVCCCGGPVCQATAVATSILSTVCPCTGTSVRAGDFQLVGSSCECSSAICWTRAVNVVSACLSWCLIAEHLVCSGCIVWRVRHCVMRTRTSVTKQPCLRLMLIVQCQHMYAMSCTSTLYLSRGHIE